MERWSNTSRENECWLLIKSFKGSWFCRRGLLFLFTYFCLEFRNHDWKPCNHLMPRVKLESISHSLRTKEQKSKRNIIVWLLRACHGVRALCPHRFLFGLKQKVRGETHLFQSQFGRSSNFTSETNTIRPDVMFSSHGFLFYQWNT